jgi:inner membrane protein
MDSLSQLALGAACGLAVMGRRTAAWKAALWGGAAGTLPDLDVVADHGDAILNMVLHRAESHSLLFLALLAGPWAGPLPGCTANRCWPGAGARPWHWPW